MRRKTKRLLYRLLLLGILALIFITTGKIFFISALIIFVLLSSVVFGYYSNRR